MYLSADVLEERVGRVEGEHGGKENSRSVILWKLRCTDVTFDCSVLNFLNT